MNKYLRTAHILLIVVFIWGSVTSCSMSASEEFEPMYWPTQAWKMSQPEEQGMDSAQLVRMFEYIEANDIDLHSLLIVRNGYLVMDVYWHPYGPGDSHSVESITKTVIGALVGIAIDRGEIKNTRQKLIDFFPERSIQNLDRDKKSIELADLLSMQPGLDCDDTTVMNGVNRASDWVKYFLDLRMSSRPGRKWIYCSGAAHLLSAVLQKETRLDARSYANQYLFAPLGIPQIAEQDWATDPQGITNGIAGLYLTPPDLAKYGFLFLNNGKWDGQQIIPAAWVHESIREQAYIGEDEYVGGLDRRFGYLWSIFPEQKYYGYLGMGGQELFVLPQENMVIAFTGALEVGQEGELLNIINDYIVPAVRSGSAISSNPEASAKLESMIQTTAGSKQPIPALPDTALNISDKKYRLEPNSLDWDTMVFHFEPDADHATLTVTGPPELQIGLDDLYRLTASPQSRPVGLRGQWVDSKIFYLDYIIFGDFIRSEALIEFDSDQIKLTITYLNWRNPPVVLRGSVRE